MKTKIGIFSVFRQPRIIPFRFQPNSRYFPKQVSILFQSVEILNTAGFITGLNLKKLSKFQMILRLILRILACVGIGLLSNVVLGIIFFLWCTTFFGVLSYQTGQVFTFIILNLAYFTGTFIAGWLSNSFKRSIITTTPIAALLGTIFILVSGPVFGIINIIVI